MKKDIIIITILTILLLVLSFFYGYIFYRHQQTLKNLNAEKKLIASIKRQYNTYVQTTKDTSLYEKNNLKYKKIGTIKKDNNLQLEEEKIYKDTKYFKIKDYNLYIPYKDIKKTTKYELDDRYKNYIPFNEDIITNNTVNFYKNDLLVLTINKSLDLKIIIKDDNGSYVTYLDNLYYVKNEDIKKTIEKENSNEEIANSVVAILYHFIYLKNEVCGEIICHPESQIEEEFNYLKENNYFTMNTKETRLFIENKINVPKKSLLVTIDDGARAEKFIPFLEKYKINATLFLVTSWYDPKTFTSIYMEIASHSNNLHRTKMCPGDQGSPMKCFALHTLVDDLKLSREKLNNTESFSYPFFEFNDRAIEAVKESGFKIAFIGGGKRINKGINLFKVPRKTINKTTDLDEFKNMINN